MAILLEIACFSAEAIDIATAAGAHRLEYSSHYELGGISPNLDEMKFVRGATPLPLSVMARPRAGDFIYSKSEKKQLLKQAEKYAENGADTIVFGCLNTDGTLDDELIQAVCKAVHPLPCGFSKAFDQSKDLFISLEQLKDCDVQFVVTSGGPGSVYNNLKTIKKLLAERENEIELLIAGGIRSDNVHEILSTTKVKEIHSSAITSGSLPDPIEIENLLNQLDIFSKKQL